MSRRVVHFEIPFDDGDRARRFYADVFGWELMPMPGMDYTMVMTGPTPPDGPPTEPGFINGGLLPREEAVTQGSVVVVDVPSIDEAVAQVEAAGGRTLRPRTPVGEMGFAAYVQDTESNVVGLWESVPS